VGVEEMERKEQNIPKNSGSFSGDGIHNSRIFIDWTSQYAIPFQMS
jgi:hypothetical protein